MVAYSTEELYYKLDNMVLSSSSHLREVFKIRWKEQAKSDWVDDKYHKDKLLKSLIPRDSKRNKCPLKDFQQTVLQAKFLAEWDMSLLSDVLLLQSTEKSKQENEAIRKLKNIRNILAHDDIGNNINGEDEYASRNCTQAEYEKHSGDLRESLTTLGMDEKGIDKLIELSGVTSSTKAVERAKALYAEAETFMKKNSFDNAIEIYTDALNTPSLLPEHRGEAFEKRAACYLKYSSETGNDFISQVLPDVMKALELNRSSWFANYLAGQYHRKKQDLPNAIHYFELALAGTPVPKQVKRDMKCCKILAGMNCNEEHMSLLLLSLNLDEQFTALEEQTEIKMVAGQSKSFFTNIGKVIPGQDHVLRGHVHFAGWDAPQDFAEAIKHYAKADRIGNTEGSFNLGKCYHFGRGVDQNVEKAMEIYRRVAKMDPYDSGPLTPLGCNVGVAYSQYSIGTLYAEGAGGVDQNLKKAAAWYKKAMENGAGFAANALGNLYANGKGIPLDEEMAERCWIKAVELGDGNAAASLVAYYIHKHKPDKAIEMMHIGRLMRNENLLSIQTDEFQAAISALI